MFSAKAATPKSIAFVRNALQSLLVFLLGCNEKTLKAHASHFYILGSTRLVVDYRKFSFISSA